MALNETDAMQAALYGALAKAQAAMGNAKKDKTNPFFKSSYADLASVTDACRKALTDNGLCVFQTMQDGPDGLMLVTTLAHFSGGVVTGRMGIKPTKQDPQGVGSAITYARRYSLAAIAGVATEDDDGNDASRKPEPGEKPADKAPSKPAVPPISPGSDLACPQCGSVKVGKQKYPKPGAEKFCADCGAAF